MTEFSIYCDKIKERIALAESRIQSEVDALLKDIKASEFDIDVNVLKSMTIGDVGTVSSARIVVKLKL